MSIECFREPVARWFTASFPSTTEAQRRAWPEIVAGRSVLIAAPTGSGKTLAAFLAALDSVMFTPVRDVERRLRVVYVSPLKALAADIEKNLQVPLAGIAAVARDLSIAHRVPDVAMRTGDTNSNTRARFARQSADILITTPESLYLLIGSRPAELFAGVETLIIDEIHSVVGSKRGAHLALSVERLETLRASDRPLQRIGLSATQRPLDEAARLLGGGWVDGSEGAWRPRPVVVIEALQTKVLSVKVEVPIEDMARPRTSAPVPASGPSTRDSIWQSIHPRLVELIRQHRSTIVFVNNRRLAERLAAALNDTAGEEIALAHHGSIAHERRTLIEGRLKSGTLPAMVATSSLELGIDMGAVDLVVQIEAPPSVASGIQRIGRAGHTVGAISRGIIFPKYRGDLLACAAVSERMMRADVEAIRYPRNPIDVLAQQIVAHVPEGGMGVDALMSLVRCAAPFADLPRSAFDGVLDMLSGRYPSDEFSGLRPRLVWDRLAGTVRPRHGARRLALVNGGTIPDRGLYGVFWTRDGGTRSVRVGELDEEMVFESRIGDTFLLGASSWRIDEITHDRVLVTPAPGKPGRMPFWHGDAPGRPVELGRSIGALARTLLEDGPSAAAERLERAHGYDRAAALNLVAYLEAQRDATGEVPSDASIVVERCVDEVGDFRVCLLSPFGARVHAPWAMAATARYRARTGREVETIWSDDGIVFRLPEAEEAPPTELFVPEPDEIEQLVTAELGATSLFAARFRESAARALLLPKRFAGHRNPLWAQRKRSANLLAVAAGYPDFPILLETYRECLRDVFDLPALTEILSQVRDQRIRLVTVDTATPSPFAMSLLFAYVGNFIYDGDAPLAERRAQVLSIDSTRLRELIGEADLRDLIDAETFGQVEASLQRLDARTDDADAVCDLLRHLGDLSLEELQRRIRTPGEVEAWLAQLEAERRVIAVHVAGEPRFAAAEDAARLRDALGVVLPPGLPPAFTQPVAEPLLDLVSRHARTHGPFTVLDVSRRLGLGPAIVAPVLDRLVRAGRVVQGEFLPGGVGVEFCDGEVLRTLKRRALARLRQQIEPAPVSAFASLLCEWHGITRPRAGPEGLIAAIEQLQGAPLVASVLERDILPVRMRDFRPADLDLLCATGEIVWRGLEPVGTTDGRIAVYLRDQYPLLAASAEAPASELGRRVRELLSGRGATFFSDLLSATGAFAPDLLRAVWELVWSGVVTNDTLAPLRALGVAATETKRPRPGSARPSRRGPPGSEGRWSLLPSIAASETDRRAALANALLARHAIVARETAHSESVPGGFSAVYAVLKTMEEAGRVRRGYFIAGLGAAQFALPGTEDRLRALRADAHRAEAVQTLAATDPCNPYGAIVPWPGSEPRLQRVAGAHVVLQGGALVAYLSRGETSVWTVVPDEEPNRARTLDAIAAALAALVGVDRRALLIETVNGDLTERSALAPALVAAGFSPGPKGYHLSAIRRASRAL